MSNYPGPCLTLTASTKGIVLFRKGGTETKMFVIHEGATPESIQDRLAKLMALGWQKA